MISYLHPLKWFCPRCNNWVSAKDVVSKTIPDIGKVYFGTCRQCESKIYTVRSK